MLLPLQRFSIGVLVCSLMGLWPSVALAQQCRLQVTITGLRSTRGQVLVALHNHAKGFPGGVALQRAVATWQGSTAVCTFEQLPAGTYAVSAFHDENGDGVLNTNWVGIPKEGYGASNNARGVMGPPQYKDAAIAVQAALVRHSLSIQY